MSRKTLFRCFFGVAAILLSCWIPVATLSVQNGKIAFISNRDGNFEIYTMNSDGSGQTRLTHHPGIDSNPAWSPDGRAIAFLRQESQGFTLNLMNENGGDIRAVPGVFCDPGAVDWSPDGSRIVFQSSGEIHTIRIDGSSRLILNRGDLGDSNPAWSPDGNTILFARTSATVGGNGIFAIGSTGGPAFPLAVHSFWYAGFYDPSWSPDGQRLLFTVPSQGDTGPSDTIVSVSPNGTGYTNIYTGQHSVGGPKYSPDGQKIVFAETLPGPTFGIYQIRLLDRVLTDLSSNNLQPDWQPLRPGASISGKVTTPGGLGLRNVTVVLTDDSGFRRTAVTSSFGIYEFNGVQPGREYTVSATSKRYRFQVRTVTLEANITGFDLEGLE